MLCVLVLVLLLIVMLLGLLLMLLGASGDVGVVIGEDAYEAGGDSIQYRCRIPIGFDQNEKTLELG
jgi:hypothetical protein